MNGRAWIVIGGLAGAMVVATAVAAAEPKLMWQVAGLDGPESAVLDAAAGELYVSNVNGGGTDVDGNGYIARISLTGEILEKAWVTGLDAPKGLALHGGRLYAADITKLRVIDVASGEVVASHDAPGATFLNDVSAHEDGRVFVSDMVQNQIWLLEGDQLGLWLEDEGLEHPNGVRAEADRLLVASWGVPNEDFSTDVPGHLKSVDYATKAVTSLHGEPVGNLDGLEPDGQGSYLVTDWFSGGLYRFDPDGKAALIMDLEPGSADLLFIEDGSLAVIPMMMDGTVDAYEVK